MSLAPLESKLTRVLEPEVMDTADEARDYDSMGHGEVNRRFAVDFLAAINAPGWPPDGLVLDLGTGTAQIPIEVCRQSAAARIVAIDLAEHMLVLGRQNVAQAGLEGRITLQRVDAKRLPYADGHFEAVMSNSIVHHIPQPRAALADAIRVVRPGGLVFVRDLSRPADDDHVRLLVDAYAGDANPLQRQLFDASLRAALCVAEIRELVAELGFDPQSVQPTTDRHWTWSAVVGG